MFVRDAPTEKPVPDAAVELDLRSAAGKRVWQAGTTTDEHGIAAADFELADQVNTGQYTVAATLDDTTSERGYRTGETVNLTVLSGTSPARVFVDVVKSQRTVITQGLDVTAGRAGASSYPSRGRCGPATKC
ncbi:MAG: hypothetical protein GY856_40375 [bacterium]|nr:hypothetical protein [bacterium]